MTEHQQNRTIGPVQQIMERQLAEGLPCAHLHITNESGNHNVPPGSETHFKVVVVSDAFTGKHLLFRHRRINGLLAELLEGRVHALALHTYTVKEWQTRFAEAPMSPPCRGGDGTFTA